MTTKSVKTLKKMLCLLLTFCIALSCAVITVSADDADPAQQPAAQTVVPIKCVDAYVWNNEDYTVYQIILRFECVSDEDGEAPEFWDVFTAMDADARLPIVCKTGTSANVTVASGYLVPHLTDDDTGDTYPVSYLFDVYQADGTPGINMVSLPILKNYAWNQYISIPEDQLTVTPFPITIGIPEGLYTGENCRSAADTIQPHVGDLPEYSQYVIPEWMGTSAVLLYQMLMECIRSYPKLTGLFTIIFVSPFAFVMSKLVKTKVFTSIYEWVIGSILQTGNDLASLARRNQVAGILFAVPVLVMIMPFILRFFTVMNHLTRDVYGIPVLKLFAQKDSGDPGDPGDDPGTPAAPADPFRSKVRDVINSGYYRISDGTISFAVENGVVVEGPENAFDKFDEVKSKIMSLTNGYSFEGMSGTQGKYSNASGGTLIINYTSNGFSSVVIDGVLYNYSLSALS